MKKLCVLLFLAILLAGCVSVEYSGEKLPARPDESNVAIFTDSAKIAKSYRVLGCATVSGNYQDVSRDRMMDKLRDEARKCGADAILIVEQQVIPASEKISGNPVFMTAFDYDDSNRSWSQIYRDVDQKFVNSDRNRSETTAGSANNFKRVIRAEFITYKTAK